MGNIRKVLNLNVLEPRTMTPNQLWVDICEDIHLHFRNYRLDFSMKEFAQFCGNLHNLYKAWEFHTNEMDYEEGDPNILKSLFANETWPADSTYYPNRLSIEEQRDGTYHIHYRDLRIHLSRDEFDDFLEGMVKAKEERAKLKPFSLCDVTEPTTAEVDIEEVQPYDAGHLPGGVCFDHDHRPGIEKVKELIKGGKKIRPILVATNGQRLDGYKRYMAYKELGHKTIPVVVDPKGKMGGQDGLSWEIKPEKGDQNVSKV